jgi:hypothetical protein
VNPFTDKDWQTVLTHLAEILGPEARRYAQVPTAKLVAAIPYLAGSEDPDRFAVSNLLTLYGATKARALFSHRADDNEDPFRRLATFHVGNHADPRVVDHGLTLLALISLADHERDAEADRRAGKPNPLNTGAWDARALRQGLEGDLGKNPSLKDAFAPFADEALEAGLWT